MSNQTFDKVPPVFSFQRCMLVTDGAFFNLIDGKFIDHPLPVIRHGLRGTQNVSDASGDSARNAERNVSNIQQTESAKTAANATGAVVTFGLRMLDLKDSLFACAADDVQTTKAVRESVLDFVERAKGSDGLVEVSQRIARNVANGSWLWRNRTSAKTIKIDIVEAVDNEKPMLTFDALSIPMNHFRDISADEKSLADILANGLRGDRDASIHVRATITFGVSGSVEVFPSQAYIEDKPQGFARPLYKLSGTLNRERGDNTEGVREMGQAGLRDQKISNRLRTIDTWYKEFDLVGRPQPIEPNGASLDLMQFFRSDRGGDSAASLFARLNAIDPSSPDGMYVIGSLIRGGVIVSKSEKKAAKAKAKSDAASEATSEVTE